MHTELIKHMSDSQVKSAMMKAFDIIKANDTKLYCELEMEVYKDIYGSHFSDWMLEKALYEMRNADGTTGGHWTVDQTTQAAKSNGITFEHFNQYDFNYVMNMVYSDYYSMLGNDTSSYIKMAKCFLFDEDAPKGKAFIYYMAMKEY